MPSQNQELGRTRIVRVIGRLCTSYEVHNVVGRIVICRICLPPTQETREPNTMDLHNSDCGKLAMFLSFWTTLITMNQSLISLSHTGATRHGNNSNAPVTGGFPAANPKAC